MTNASVSAPIAGEPAGKPAAPLRLGETLRCTTYGDDAFGGASVFEPRTTPDAAAAARGTPLFVAPGFGLDGRVFEPLAALAPKRRLVFWNLPNRLPERGGTAALASLYLAHADLAGMPHRFVFGGASLGGTIAVAAALAAPERCAGLVLAAGSASWAELGWFLRLAPFVHRLLPARGYHRRLARVLFGKAGRSPTLDALRGQALHRTKDHAGSVIRLLHEGGPFDLRARLGEIRAPALLLHDPGEKVVPIGASRTLTAIPGSRLVELPDAGHLPVLGDPEATVREVAAFLDAVDAIHATDATERQ